MIRNRSLLAVLLLVVIGFNPCSAELPYNATIVCDRAISTAAEGPWRKDRVQSAEKVKGVHVGMSQTEVCQVLGNPTSVKDSEWAYEFGDSCADGALLFSVTFRDLVSKLELRGPILANCH